MKQHISKLALAALLTLAVTAVAMAQTAPPKPLIPIKVQVVIARYEGDKKVSSLPYTLSVTANDSSRNGNTSIRMGSQVPIPTMTTNATPPSNTNTYTYMNVGTSIDCWAASTDDGRFSVNVSIEDSSVMERRPSDAAPTLRNFTTKNNVILKDGQTTQFTAAADKTTGEVVKVDVTLTVDK
jgi:hypothetical protein